jgi:hypothetical protein
MAPNAPTEARHFDFPAARGATEIIGPDNGPREEHGDVPDLGPLIPPTTSTSAALGQIMMKMKLKGICSMYQVLALGTAQSTDLQTGEAPALQNALGQTAAGMP